MRCTSCGDYRDPADASCPACGVTLVRDEEPSRARVGRFHPAAARAVVELALRRGAHVQANVVDDMVDVLVPKERRDGLRAELVLTWDVLLARLPPHDQAEVKAQGGQLPGWDDTPDGVWVDRDGRLRVARAQEEADEDAGRVVGPMLVIAAIFLLLVAWHVGDDHLRLLAAIGGFGLLLVGTFLPR